MHLTQPAVSMQVKQLEEQVGVPLTEMLGKRLLITEAGQELRAHALRIIAQTEELKSAMDQFRGLERGLLRLAVVSTANYFLPTLIATFIARHAGVRVSLQVANREEVLAALADNSADLAITGQPPDTGELTGERFMPNPLVVVAPPTHPLAGQPKIPLRKLATETLVVREEGSGTRAAIDRFLKSQGVNYQPGCELGTNEAIKQAVQAGLGLAIVPLQTVELELETARLVILPFEGFPLLRHWYVVHRADKRLSVAAQAFRAVLLAQDGADDKPVTTRRSRSRGRQGPGAT
jgi:DNA-binding transcriptional LysR family regulator